MGLFSRRDNTHFKTTKVAKVKKNHLGYDAPTNKVVINTETVSDEYGEMPDVEMSTLVSYYETCYLFGAAVDLHAATATGNSYRLSVNPENESDAEMAAEIQEKITDVCKQFKLDDWIHMFAVDVFMSGNWFGSPLKLTGEGEDTKISGFRPVQLSSMIGIHRDRDGDVDYYVQSTSMTHSTHQSIGGHNKIRPDAIHHFSRNNTNGSAWGRGMGQRAARRGVGYKLPNGTTTYRPSLFETLEMIDDVSGKMYYGGQPRYLAILKSADPNVVDDVNEQLDEMPPLSHSVINGEGDIKTIGLDTASRFSDILKHIRDNVTMCFLNPSYPLWTNNSFSYASSQTAQETLMPMITGYQRDHKSFIENEFLKPIIEHMYGEGTWDKIGMEFEWEESVALKMLQLKDILPVLESSLMKRYIRHEDMFDIVNKLGWALNPKDEDDLEPIPDFTPSGADSAEGNNDESGDDSDNMEPGQDESAEIKKLDEQIKQQKSKQKDSQLTDAQLAAFKAVASYYHKPTEES